MPTITDPLKLADTVEDAASLILRWGHGQMRQLPAAEIEMIVAALRGSPEAPANTVPVRVEIINYLIGTAPHPETGKWFGDDEDATKGRFFWRRTLWQEVRSPLPQEVEG